ncbi:MULTISPECIES: aminotransferase class I/II-fold pyridoxal phosphate-dependent enzyme [unclassified Novosphingobium]|uniref:aminotransferase class I/II-fold pyridoxal phosphate-dependent enzyme n=1 Tax=unclassified Novosphingobium TaxID=2644732 RepID=UPI001494AD65|nr:MULTISPECIES: aminotransferase class I/II-fold pyridoxal phosphate-dependent enzyme [unclassified Novosphingobium]MBB3356708.1 aspartate/methionine/tyrosine aminotransferase [Novosphingobium sp. BK256]MBB3373109.1 aspartate/methionine/tyrosine aminotransferase [Novosphingobium sp. BK280]MBB3377477.1 aspartate/methionine/tyrosine aminotransferase [Novosphingobium sp. BK258]MBB3419112.1 aspartate/methionine/tyrosine aminotransferase [Novosphingobium sp. BK267]MBB3449071.1 aspartate/methionine
MTAPSLNPLYATMPTTIFEAMSALAREHGAINLGQGFPDGPPPLALAQAAARAMAERSQQYPPMAGVPELRDAVAAFYARRQGLALGREHAIVTSGATEAVAAAILATVRAGDEVLVLAPAYDAYAPLVRRAGGVPVFVGLAPPDWAMPIDAVRAAVTPRTRALILNDPLNPTGTVTSAAERTALAQLCVSANLIAICDEVWEVVRFDGLRHASLMAEPGMAARTIKVGSAGKIFGATGWKVGWLVADPALATVVARAHQFLTFTTPPMLQWAVAEGLTDDALIDAQVADWAASRQALLEALAHHGFATLPGSATWFSCIDLAQSGVPLDDRTFATRAVAEAGVATIPLSALWEGPPAPRHIVRLCHCKPPPMLRAAVGKLAAWRDGL